MVANSAGDVEQLGNVLDAIGALVACLADRSRRVEVDLPALTRTAAGQARRGGAAVRVGRIGLSAPRISARRESLAIGLPPLFAIGAVGTAAVVSASDATGDVVVRVRRRDGSAVPGGLDCVDELITAMGASVIHEPAGIAFAVARRGVSA
jgi:hypothetical protein